MKSKFSRIVSIALAGGFIATIYNNCAQPMPDLQSTENNSSYQFSELKLEANPSSVNTGGTVALVATGGTPPYGFAVVSGTVSTLTAAGANAILQAASTPETALVEVSDANQSKVSLSVAVTLVGSGSACSLRWGGSIANGASVTAYQASISATTCMSETQVCNNGTLSGSYTKKSCTTCGGKIVGDACWYAGNADQNCNQVCNGHGGYDVATRTYAGDQGTSAQCKNVLDALNLASGGVSILSDCSPAGIGCGVQTFGTNQRYRCVSPNTSAPASTGGFKRACACMN